MSTDLIAIIESDFLTLDRQQQTVLSGLINLEFSGGHSIIIVPIAIPPPPPVSNTVKRARFVTKLIFGSITSYLLWVLMFKTKDPNAYWFSNLESTTDLSSMKADPPVSVPETTQAATDSKA